MAKVCVEDHHKLLMCATPKVGSSTWKTLFLVLSGRYNSSSEMGTRSDVHGNMPCYIMSDERWDHYKDYTSFLFVRHPFSKLLSAYKDKITPMGSQMEGFAKNTIRHILRTYRKIKSPIIKNTESEYNVTFEEFAMYVAGTRDDPLSMNRHWIPQYLNCDVCSKKFDVIGKLETFTEDSIHILERVHAKTNLNFTPTTSLSTNVQSSGDEYILEYFKHLNSTLVKQLYELYEMDFKLFGYKYPEYLLSS
ncbi:carbohydrate sulfotransferase 11-like [Saccoglossus kowalevskii]